MEQHMRSLWFVRMGQLEWRDVPAPRLAGDLEALVEPIAASTCDIDRLVVSRPSPFSEPYPIGHNAVARVIEVGDRVSSVKPGDVVAVAWHITCGECDRCKRGLLSHCRRRPDRTSYGLPGTENWGGLFDDIVRVPFADQMLHRLPGTIDPVEFVALSDNLTVGYSTVARHIKAGRDRVLVLGWGINGLYSAAFAQALGAREVTYVDDNAANIEAARQLGVAISAGPVERGMGPFDLIVDADNDPSWLRRGLLALEPEGVIECVGHIADVTVPGWAWYGLGATLHCGVCPTGPDVGATIELVERGAVIPSNFCSERVAWDEDLPAAFATHRRQLVAVRGPH
jgi:threonine dehydrogenase-like Zn-dependent dehydrogenase